jgi:hypothetical protein
MIVTKVPLISTPIHSIDGVRFRLETQKGTKFVNLHEDILRQVNKVFANQPLDPGKGSSNPPGPPRPPRYLDCQW